MSEKFNELIDCTDAALAKLQGEPLIAPNKVNKITFSSVDTRVLGLLKPKKAIASHIEDERQASSGLTRNSC